jgi:hypothetical protein
MRSVVPALLLLALGASVARAGDEPREYLDDTTAATITVVSEPMVFAAARPDLAANVRDYVTLAAAAVDRSGRMSYVIIAYYWSTVDPRLRRAPVPAPDPLLLQADDRRIRLSSGGQTAREAGIGMAVHAPTGSDAPPHTYPTDLATLRYICEARRLSIIADTELEPLGAFALWQDGRPALREFVRHLNGGVNPGR